MVYIYGVFSLAFDSRQSCAAVGCNLRLKTLNSTRYENIMSKIIGNSLTMNVDFEED